MAFGACFDSGTKPAAVRAPLSLFGEAAALELPTVAIGGIRADNAASVIAAGADSIAVVDALFGADDPEQAARTFSDLFLPKTPS